MRKPPIAGWRSVSIAATAAIAVLHADAHARELSEILQDKGVITRDEYKEAAKTKTKPSISYKEGKGFVFETPDNRFSLAVGGRIQVRYTLTDVDERFVNPQKGTEDSQTFDVQRMRLWWEGTAFTPDLFYKVQIDAVGGGGDILRDAELGYILIQDYLVVKGGQMKTTYCRQEMTSSGRLEFVDRSVACNNFRFERDKGVQLYGNPWNSLIEYYAGAYNGTGRNGPANPDTNFLYVGRFVVNPLGPVPYSEADFGPTESPLFALGMSYGYEKAKASEFTTAATTGPSATDPDMTVITQTGQAQNNVPYLRMIQPYYNRLANTNALTVEVQNLEWDFAFRWLGLDVNFEYYKSFNANSAFPAAAPAAPYVLPPGNFNGHGYYTQAGYFIIPKKLQMAFRYSTITPNEKAVVTKASGSEVTQGQDEMLGAISYYFAQHNLKLQTDFGPVNQYGVRDVAGQVTDQHNFRWRVQAQLIF
jgi:phosphate-selective porin OprO/OprP